VSVNRTSTTHGCDYFVTFSRGNAPDYNRYMLKGSDIQAYQLYRAFPYIDVLKDFSDAVTNSDVIANSFPDHAGSMQNAESYRAVLATASYRPVGFYSDSVLVRLYEGTLSSYTLRDSTYVSFFYSSTRSIDLSLVSTGAPFDASATSRTLDFGTLYQDEALSFDIVLKTNAGYSVSMSSQNGGMMKHVSLAGNSVPYSMSVNGVAVGLGAGNEVVATGSGASSSEGTRVPVLVSIGSLSNSASGDYRDFITITVQTTQ
jgi:spore coat protein U-like protein